MSKRELSTNIEDLGTDEITEAFLRTAGRNPEYIEAENIVRGNTSAGIWLIGGFVYRGIVADLYGVQVSTDADFDFIVEKPSDSLKLPDGWEIITNRYGNPKFVGPKYEIDFVPIKNVHSILRRGLAPTISNFLSGAPLTVQSIAFDVLGKKVIGGVGRRAIILQTVGVNNEQQATHRAELKGKTVQELVTETAQSLNFTAE